MLTSSVVGETSGETESLKFGGLGLAEDLVTLDGGVDDLSNDLSVGESSNQSVFWGVVFVLVLGDQSLSGIVVSFALYLNEDLLD